MTNFLSESDFERFLHSLRQLLQTNKQSLEETGRTLSMPIDGFVELFRLAYGSALRISETLTVYPDDFDFSKNLVILRQTKTGYKICKCSHYEKTDFGGRRLVPVGCEKCEGLGKIRTIQRTTIHPKFRESLWKYIATYGLKSQPLFRTNRFTLWSYAKQAGKLAELNVFEEQKDRMIEGIWTHLFRKSRAKQMMQDVGADEKESFVYELLKVKLRHSRESKDVTQRYSNIIGQKLGLNDLLEWEAKHYG